MTKGKGTFYTFLVGLFPVFYLLHWNGLFANTYYWALEAINKTHSFFPQMLFSLMSAIIIFGIIAIIFEAFISFISKPKTCNQSK